jgi:hypothetical protein
MLSLLFHITRLLMSSPLVSLITVQSMISISEAELKYMKRLWVKPNPGGFEVLSKSVANNLLGVDLFGQSYRSTQTFLCDGTNCKYVVFCIDPEWHRIVFADYFSDWIDTYGSQGSDTPIPHFAYPRGIDADNSGNVYVADTGNDRIVKLSYDYNAKELSFISTIERELGSPSESDLNAPWDVDIDVGAIWVVDSGNDRIVKYSSDGTLLGQYGGQGSGTGEFSSPQGITRGKTSGANNDYLYVADSGNNRIVLLEGDINSLSWIRSYSVPGIKSIDVDYYGTVWAVGSSNKIWKFTPTLDFLYSWGESGIGPNKFNNPIDINIGYFDGQSHMLISEAWTASSGGQHYVPAVDIINIAVVPDEESATAEINFTLTEYSFHFHVRVINTGGATIKTFYDNEDEVSPGQFTLFWDGRNDQGEIVQRQDYKIYVQATVRYQNDTCDEDDYCWNSEESDLFQVGDDGVGPVINEVSANPDPEVPRATITWTTDELSTSQIEYGLTTDYGFLAALDEDRVFDHSQILTGLRECITYHYRVRSKDIFGHESFSDDYTFMTSGSPSVLEVPSDVSTIQDALDAVCSGYTIRVSASFFPGQTYYEHLTMKDNIHLIKDGDWEIILDGSGYGNVVTGADNCIIQGFTITNGESGIYTNNSNFTVRACVLNNNQIGIEIDKNAESIVVDQCEIVGSNLDHTYGIELNSEGLQWSREITITHCVIDDQYEGVILRGEGLSLTHCTFLNCSKGVKIESGLDLSSRIKNNIVYDCSYGVYIFTNQPFPEIISYNDVNSFWFCEDCLEGSEGLGDFDFGENKNCTPCDIYQNISQNPQLVDDYDIQSTSPCIDAGDPHGSTDPDGTIADIGAFYHHQSGPWSEIDLSATTRDYGGVLLHSTSEWTLTISNIGSATLNVCDITSDNEAFAVFSPSFPQAVASGENVNVTVTFSPQTLGTTDGLLRVHSNDPKEWPSLSLTGEGLAPDIEVTPIAFHEAVYEGHTGDAEMFIENQGTYELSFNITDSEIWLSVNPTSGTIDPESNTTVDLAFDATTLTPGIYSGNVTIITNDPDEEEVIVPVNLSVEISHLIAYLTEIYDLPGETIAMPLEVDNFTEITSSIAEVLIHLDYNDSILSYESISRTDRTINMDVCEADASVVGRLVLHISDMGEDLISSGEGSIADIFFHINESTQCGQSTLVQFADLDDPDVGFFDDQGIEIPNIETTNGTVQAGMRGDPNGDHSIDVLDAIVIINIILGDKDPTTYENCAADANDDNDLNILDVLMVVNIILGNEPVVMKQQISENFGKGQLDAMPIRPQVAQIEVPVSISPSGTAKLPNVNNGVDVDVLPMQTEKGSGQNAMTQSWTGASTDDAELTLKWAVGSEGDHEVILSNSMDVGGVEVWVAYDSTQMTPEDPIATYRCSELQFSYSIQPDKIVLLLYSFDRSKIDPGDGVIIELPSLTPGGGDMTITKAVLSTPYADRITVSVHNAPHIPTSPIPADGAVNQPTSANISWIGTDPDIGDNVTYDVYFEAADPTPDVHAYSGPNNVYDPGTLISDTQYFWKVTSTDGSGLTTEGPIWDFTTVCVDPIPPCSLTTTDGCYEISLNWQDDSDVEIGFKIERKTGATGAYSQIAAVGENVTSYTDTELSGTTEYY